MKLNGIDFNLKLANLKAASFAKYYKDGDWEKKTGMKATDAHKALKDEAEKQKALKNKPTQ